MYVVIGACGSTLWILRTGSVKVESFLDLCCGLPLYSNSTGSCIVVCVDVFLTSSDWNYYVYRKNLYSLHNISKSFTEYE